MFEQFNSPTTLPNQNPHAPFLNEALVEKIWFELDEQATREQIRQAATEVAAQFKGAAITTFIPIFIYRHTCEKLKRELGGR